MIILSIPANVAEALVYCEGFDLNITARPCPALAANLRAVCWNAAQLELKEDPSSELATDYLEVVSQIDRQTLPRALELA